MARAAIKVLAIISAFCVVPLIARADDYLLAQSNAHKLKVFADGGAKWCGPHLALKVALDADSPDIGNPSAVNDLLNRLKSPIGNECPAALDATAAVSAQGKALGGYKASKDAGWLFATTAPAPHGPASLDDEPTPTAPPPKTAAAAALPPTQPEDVAGSHDPAFLKRFTGATIARYLTRSFDEYTFFVGKNFDPAKMEGQVTRIFYRIPVGYTALELLRNYQAEVKAAGLDITAELLPCKVDYVVIEQRVWAQNGLEMERNNNPYLEPHMSGDDADGPACYFSARGTRDDQDIGISVMVVEKHRNMNPWKDVTFKPGEIVVGVDIVTAKAVAIQMVAVKASDLAAALASKGSIDLYGILFDTDKTDIKPESDKTLDEIASLLKIDQSLKLEISGHTDNTGSAEHNQKLSEGRAQAVVAALVKTYGIDATRLTAAGFGDTRPVADNGAESGRAKNRRVELRKL